MTTKLEEDDDPDATVGEFDLNSPHSYSPQSRPEDSEGGYFQPQAAGFMVPYTDNFSNVGVTTRGIGECIQEPSNFGGDSNTYGESSSLVIFCVSQFLY